MHSCFHINAPLHAEKTHALNGRNASANPWGPAEAAPLQEDQRPCGVWSKESDMHNE